MRFKKLGAGLGIAGLVSISLVSGSTQQAAATPADITSKVAVADINFAATNSNFLSPGNGNPAADTTGPSNVDGIFYDASSYENDAVFETTDGKGVKYKSSPSAVQYPNDYDSHSNLFIQDDSSLVVDQQQFVAAVNVNLGSAENFADSTNIFQRGRYGVASDANGGQIKLQTDEAYVGADTIQGTADDFSLPQCRFEATNSTDTDATMMSALVPSSVADSNFTFNATDGAFHTYECWFDGDEVGLSIDGVVFDSDSWSFSGSDRSFSTASSWPWRLGTQLGYDYASGLGPKDDNDTCKNCSYDWFKLEVKSPSAASADPETGWGWTTIIDYDMNVNGSGVLADGLLGVNYDLEASNDWSEPSTGIVKFGDNAKSVAKVHDEANDFDPQGKSFKVDVNAKSYSFATGFGADVQTLVQKGSYTPSGEDGYWKMALVPGTGQVVCTTYGSTDNVVVVSQQRVTDGLYHDISCQKFKTSAQSIWRYSVSVDGHWTTELKNIGTTSNSLPVIMANKGTGSDGSYTAANQGKFFVNQFVVHKDNSAS